jgi:hypothetical protein
MGTYQVCRYLALNLNIQIFYNTYQKCTKSCHIPVPETIYRKVLSIILTFTSMLHGKEDVISLNFRSLQQLILTKFEPWSDTMTFTSKKTKK